MKQNSRPSYLSILASTMGIVGRRVPVVFLSLVVVYLVLMGTNVLGFHLLERVISRLSDTEHLHELVQAIVVVGIVLVIPEVLEMVADPIGTLFWGKSVGALTETMNEKVRRLEVIDFETVDAHERLELASAGKYGAVSMLLSFLFPVFQLVFFTLAGLYLYTLSPPLALVIPLIFAPRIVSHLVRGSRYYQLERKTVPMRREFQYLEQCVVDREYFKETRILGVGSHLLQRYRDTIRRFNMHRWREDRRMARLDLGLNVLVVLGYGGAFTLAALLLPRGSISVGGFAVVVYAVSKFMLMTSAVTEMFGESYRDSATAAHFIEFLERDEGRPMENGGGGESAVGVAARGGALSPTRGPSGQR